MLSKIDVEKWKMKVNWPRADQVEQDLIISICLVKLFSDPFLSSRLAFRGGTALNKLIFPKAMRYSEDIDLNRLQNDGAGPIIDQVRKVFNDVFSLKPKIKQTEQSIKIIYSYDSIENEEKKLKIEINVRETLPQDDIVDYPFEVESDFFSGKTNVRGFSKEEMIGTKIRALYQRKKGRDLFDLYELSKLGIDWDKVVERFKKLNIGATQKNFKNNMDEKMQNQTFLNDIGPLLPSKASYDVHEAYDWFQREILPKL